MMSNTRVAVRVVEQPQRQTQKNLWICFWVLAALASFCLNVSAAPHPQDGSAVSADEVDTKDKPQKEELVATFAGGCFWCTEAVFERMIGVNDVISGYIGGTVPNPTYEQVCGKKTGHAEAVEIYYDPSQVTFEELLEVFFKTHDPTTLNRQGADEGPQYRSSVFFHNEQQKDATEAYIKKLNKSGEFDREIVTLLEKATTFYPAEEVHQDFYRKNPNYGYCQAVVRDKVRKFNRNFGDKIKK
ncbi:MAG: peptide-methionine (S)-S-oxide reductase MsrA [Phycisphaera sp. RhM]|nr:peptide-methionine (S)-S-oxide reductase MsrA [Phycisphaera sp. RhM]